MPLPADGSIPAEGEQVFVAIRAEFVALRNEDHPPKAGEFVLQGRFTSVSVTGTDVTLVFQPDGLDASIEISHRPPVASKVRRQGRSAGHRRPSPAGPTAVVVMTMLVNEEKETR